MRGPKGYAAGERIYRQGWGWYEWNGEYRPPLKGEFYLSGTIPGVWDTPNEPFESRKPFYIMVRVPDPPERIERDGFTYKLERLTP